MSSDVFVTEHLEAISKLCGQLVNCRAQSAREPRCKEMKIHIAALEGFFWGLRMEMKDKEETE